MATTGCCEGAETDICGERNTTESLRSAVDTVGEDDLLCGEDNPWCGEDDICCQSPLYELSPFASLVATASS
jgi:hypothetical protein